MKNETSLKVGDIVKGNVNGQTFKIVELTGYDEAYRGDAVLAVRWIKSRKSWTQATTLLPADHVTLTENPEA